MTAHRPTRRTPFATRDPRGLACRNDEAPAYYLGAHPDDWRTDPVGPTLEAVAEILEASANHRVGARPVPEARVWLAAGFDIPAVADWVAVGGFTPHAVGELADYGLEPEQCALQATSTGGTYTGTLAYLHSVGDYTLGQVLEALGLMAVAA